MENESEIFAGLDDLCGDKLLRLHEEAASTGFVEKAEGGAEVSKEVSVEE